MATTWFIQCDADIAQQVGALQAMKLQKNNQSVLIQGALPSYNHLWSTRFIQLTSGALKNFASDTAVKLPAKLIVQQPALFISEDGKTSKGKYENDELFEWVEPRNDVPEFVKKKKEELKPANSLRQRVNDFFNGQYISALNIGLLSINAPEITNFFYSSNGKLAERTWSFSNDKYRE